MALPAKVELSMPIRPALSREMMEPLLIAKDDDRIEAAPPLRLSSEPPSCPISAPPSWPMSEATERAASATSLA